MVENERHSGNTIYFKLLLLTLTIIVSCTVLEIASRRIMPRALYVPKIDLKRYPAWSHDGIVLWNMNQHYDDSKLERFKNDSDSFKIVGIGDSIMNGSFIPPEKTYMAMMEETLKNKGMRAITLDLSIPGYNFLQEASLYLDVAREMNPDLIVIHSWEDDMREYKIVGDKVFDLENYSRDGFIHTIPLPDAANQFLITRSRFYQLASFQLMKFKYRGLNEGGGEEQKVYELFNEMLESVGGDGSKILFLLSPRLDQGPIESFTATNNHSGFYLTIQDMAERNNARALELGILLNGIDGSEIGVDQCHFNEKGHKLLAERLSDYILKEIKPAGISGNKNR